PGSSAQLLLHELPADKAELSAKEQREPQKNAGREDDEDRPVSDGWDDAPGGAGSASPGVGYSDMTVRITRAPAAASGKRRVTWKLAIVLTLAAAVATGVLLARRTSDSKDPGVTTGDPTARVAATAMPVYDYEPEITSLFFK